MSKIVLRGNHYADTTLVSNVFIDEYMTAANEAQIKIYLYLLRCIGDNLSVSVSSIADKYNYTEKDILRALLYWDKAGLLTIEFDEARNVVGICLNDCVYKNTEAAPQPEILQARPVQPERPVVVPPDSKAKPFYSQDKMNAFRNQEEVQQLIFMTEHYMGKTLSHTDINTLLYLYDELHFPVDLIEYLIEYCVNNNHKSIRYIEKTALAWAEEGISSVKEAKANTSRYKTEYYSVLKAFGISGRNPVESDIEFIKRWTNEYGFDMDLILEACSRTMKAIAKPSFGYTDSILKSWKEKKIHHKSDLNALDLEHRKVQKSATGTTSSSNKFRNFSERDCDFDELAKDLLRN